MLDVYMFGIFEIQWNVLIKQMWKLAFLITRSPINELSNEDDNILERKKNGIIQVGRIILMRQPIALTYYHHETMEASVL